MATTLDALKRQVSRVLKESTTGREVIEGRVGETAAPAKPYFMFSVDDFTPQDFPVVEIKEALPDDLQVVTSTATPITFLIDVVGADAMTDASRAMLSLRISQRAFDLYAICGLLGISRPINLSALELGTHRSRVQFRLTLSAALDFTAASEVIDSIEIAVKEPVVEFDKTLTIQRGVNPNGC